MKRVSRFYMVALYEGPKHVYSRGAPATDRKSAARGAIKAYAARYPDRVEGLTLAMVYRDADTTNATGFRIVAGKV